MAGNSGNHFAIEGFVSVEQQRYPIGFRRFHSCRLPVKLFLFCFRAKRPRYGMFSKQRSKQITQQQGDQAAQCPARRGKQWMMCSRRREDALIASARLEWDGHGTCAVMGWFLVA
jgi:hypothetical protein